MDSGFNMLGQFQGDSSFGLGQTQDLSTKSFNIQPVGFYKDFDECKTEAEKKEKYFDVMADNMLEVGLE